MKLHKDIIFLTVLTVTLVLFANIGWQLLRPKPQQPQAVAQLGPDNTAVAMSKQRRVLLNRFRKANTLAQPVDHAQMLECNLQLLGTIKGNVSMAFICDPDTGTRALYRIHDKVKGFVIEDIDEARVVLRDGVKVKELTLSAGKTQIALAGDVPVTVDGSGKLIINKSELMNEVLKDKQVISQVKIFPVNDATNQKLSGLRVEDLPSGSIFENVGLRNGDIIYSVEGQRIQSMQDAWQMFNRLQTQSQIDVVLVRNNEPVSLHYEIRN